MSSSSSSSSRRAGSSTLSPSPTVPSTPPTTTTTIFVTADLPTSTPSPSSSPSLNSRTKGIIAGASVGGFILVLACFGILFWFCIRTRGDRKKKHHRKRTDGPHYRRAREKHGSSTVLRERTSDAAAKTSGYDAAPTTEEGDTEMEAKTSEGHPTSLSDEPRPDAHPLQQYPPRPIPGRTSTEMTTSTYATSFDSDGPPPGIPIVRPSFMQNQNTTPTSSFSPSSSRNRVSNMFKRTTVQEFGEKPAPYQYGVVGGSRRGSVSTLPSSPILLGTGSASSSGHSNSHHSHSGHLNQNLDDSAELHPPPRIPSQGFGGSLEPPSLLQSSSHGSGSGSGVSSAGSGSLLLLRPRPQPNSPLVNSSSLPEARDSGPESRTRFSFSRRGGRRQSSLPSSPPVLINRVGDDLEDDLPDQVIGIYSTGAAGETNSPPVSYPHPIHTRSEDGHGIRSSSYGSQSSSNHPLPPRPRSGGSVSPSLERRNSHLQRSHSTGDNTQFFHEQISRRMSDQWQQQRRLRTPPTSFSFGGMAFMDPAPTLHAEPQPHPGGSNSVPSSPAQRHRRASSRPSSPPMSESSEEGLLPRSEADQERRALRRAERRRRRSSAASGRLSVGIAGEEEEPRRTLVLRNASETDEV